MALNLRLLRYLVLITTVFTIVYVLFVQQKDTTTTPTLFHVQSTDAALSAVVNSSGLSCFRIKRNSLPDISDIGIPKGSKSIFFLDTSCKSADEGKIIISPRAGCAVESAARLNPNTNIYLLYLSPGLIQNENTTSGRVLKNLLAYKNINIFHINYEKFTRGTPMEIFYKEYKIESSKFPINQASDVLRFLLLWKYGGIYIDSDSILLKSLEDFPLNFANLESEFKVGCSIIGFSSEGAGHQLAERSLGDFKENYKGDVWGHNCVVLITRLVERVCKVKEVKDTPTKQCQDFNVFPNKGFYPVPWKQWYKYFQEKYAKDVIKLVKDSYGVHVWNWLSKTTTISVKSKVAYNILAEKHCPGTFAQVTFF